MSTVLHVRMHQRLAGYLTGDKKGNLTFQYDDGWLARHNAMPVSLSLPLQQEPFENGEAIAYFANLLPDGDLRTALAKQLKTKRNDLFALLKVVAGECAGSIRIVSANKKPDDSENYRKLTNKTLDTTLQALAKQPLLAGRKGIRMSLAGTHCKLPVLLDDKSIASLPLDNAPSNYILKPSRKDITDSVENEYFCMKLAAGMGLNVAPVQLLEKSKRIYAVGRFDRETRKNGKIFRLHQEDFCQALGVLPEAKYEAEGGPSFKECFDLVRRVSIQPMADLRALLNWVTFNFLIGNEGIHGKNLSFYLTEQGPRLCPFYDLMSTAIYPSLSYRMVMKIGGEDRPNWMTKTRWQNFAKEIGMNPKIVHQTLTKMSKSALKQAKEEAKEYYISYGYSEVIDKILELIETRCQKVGRRLARTTNS